MRCTCNEGSRIHSALSFIILVRLAKIRVSGTSITRIALFVLDAYLLVSRTSYLIRSFSLIRSCSETFPRRSHGFSTRETARIGYKTGLKASYCTNRCDDDTMMPRECSPSRRRVIVKDMYYLLKCAAHMIISTYR